MSEIYKKGWQIKESTIKSYISKDLLPRALKRVKTNKGMESIYPSDTIRHLNFTRYCLFSDDYSIKAMLSLVNIKKENDLEILISTNTNDGYPFNCLDPYGDSFATISDTKDNWASKAIREAFGDQPEKCDLYISKLNKSSLNLRNF
jgi:hypothetical protein